MSFNVVFLLYLAVFFVILFYGGWMTRKWVNSANDYLLGGREVGMLINVFGVAAIGFAGTIITLGPGLAITSGFWGSFGFGIAYLFGGLALYGIVLAPYIRRCGAQTLPEWLAMRFDSRTRVLVTIASILGLIGIMANNVVSMAIVVNGFTGWSLVWTLSAIFLLFLLFTYAGGFWAITLTDFVQMCIGLIALPLMFLGLLSRFGGFDFISSQWPGPSGHWTHGITGGQLPIFSLQYPSLLTFVILFGCFLVWGNNYYWLRVSSTRSEKVAKHSFIYAAVLLALVPYLILVVTGLYAGAAFPDTFEPKGNVSPMAAFGVVLKALPVSVTAFALIGALAASISTSTTALIGASSTAVRDLYQRYIRPNATPRELTMPSKVITICLGLLVWVLCFYPGGPLYLFAFATAWLGPPSVLVMLGIWWRRTTKQGAFIGALAGIGVTGLFTLLELMKVFVIGTYTHVGVVGLVVTLVCTVIVSLMTQPQYYGDKNWKLEGQADSNSLSVSMEEQVVLQLMYAGYNTMAEITDMLGEDSTVSNRLVESLDQKRLIFRESYTGPGFYTFRLAEEATRLMDESVSVIHADKGMVSREDLVILQKVGEGSSQLNAHIRQHELDSLKVSVIVAKLIRQGYLEESGLWRRKMAITTDGRQILTAHAALLQEKGA
ncbi:sodium:solute symporter family protein [Brevibacillus ruminantium]|uniref:Sodium:solute symporter family protein n=1 Tax=Brevibacillus ruminantium TaxID=2950604 RepID=A0ABY4WIC8_9BACL|nr:sodium:solute symporter family protein [Brevibacillus ruminantium]USG66906.1 sodium:solute symporter family protein [Brevibacillus ruminantium]